MDYISQYYYYLKQISYFQDNNLFELTIAVVSLLLFLGPIFLIIKIVSSFQKPQTKLIYITESDLYRIFIRIPGARWFVSSELQINSNQVSFYNNWLTKKTYDLKNNIHLDIKKRLFGNTFVMVFDDGYKLYFWLLDENSIKNTLDILINKKIIFTEDMKKYYESLV